MNPADWTPTPMTRDKINELNASLNGRRQVPSRVPAPSSANLQKLFSGLVRDKWPAATRVSMNSRAVHRRVHRKDGGIAKRLGTLFTGIISHVDRHMQAQGGSPGTVSLEAVLRHMEKGES